MTHLVKTRWPYGLIRRTNMRQLGLGAMVQERPVRVERRLAAIMAADVAGYSRLMHDDEEATHARLTELLTDVVIPAIAEHGGRIVKNTGDGFLAEFPSAVEAVRAAKQFQTRIHEITIDEAEDNRIAFRVGINIGDVIVEPHDPIATHLIDGLARPGGNITGISDNATTLSTKRLELIKQAVPKLQRVAMLWNRNDLGMTQRYEASASAAQSMGVTVQALGVREPDDFNGVFEAMDRDPPDAILMVSDALTTLNRKRVFDYADAHHIPALYEYDPLVRDG